ncbi:hypothetical protein HYH03_006912 [Edaphochlamys debaryana]|uniref:SREBP regulating gene protein n=1 Tax=Edaphochlamys debaryana TaxID=47281 RepID=A0A836C0Y9_9CHLO|nr:hypothetical protein HYH03_006912 [Edaphochlamys debaryana]|eukprot:KAG2494979.1 hypothetical protein HYH03_006912 [Edaphochlamys debaryana]
MRDQCCTEYEACVSCCLAPQHEAAKLAKEVLRSPRHKESGVWGDAFSYCMGVCRTHSRSTAHENSYISPRHHCFSKLGRPMLSDPLPPGALADVEVVTSERNGTCDEACTKLQGKPKKCSIVHLNVLNSCDRLREHHGCEAGCEEASGLGPSYVDPEAPKPARPAMCFVQPQGDPLVQCGSRTPHHMMLCACSAQ